MAAVVVMTRNFRLPILLTNRAPFPIWSPQLRAGLNSSNSSKSDELGLQRDGSRHSSRSDRTSANMAASNAIPKAARPTIRQYDISKASARTRYLPINGCKPEIVTPAQRRTLVGTLAGAERDAECSHCRTPLPSEQGYVGGNFNLAPICFNRD